jgi:methylated-DNA-[protein]-cysteine S-methyltransferase
MARIAVDSPLGPLTLTAQEGHLVALDWGGCAPEGEDPALAEAARQLAEYFAGQRADFALPVRPAGTPFQRRVWDLMRTLPPGRPATYGDMARRLGSVARAVGGACGANPLPIVIPCHRVVAAAGKGGYSGLGGLSTKDWLLAHERRMRPGADLPAPDGDRQMSLFPGPFAG